MFARKSSPMSLVACAMGGAMLPGIPWFLQMTPEKSQFSCANP
jgi:hypothetical protein